MVWHAFRNTTNWDPWRELLRLHHQMDNVFSELPGRSTEFPAVDVASGADGLIVVAQVPGVAPDDIELTVVGDVLTLKGNRPDTQPTGNGQSFHRRERELGRFVRTLQLPYAVEADRVQARFKHGLLRIELPRAAADKPRKIAVAAE